MKRLIFAVLLALGLALAHAELDSSTPAANSTIKILPQTVQITFSEAIEVKLSSFKIYKLAGSFATEKAGQTAAAALVRKVMGAKGDQAQRFDDGLATTAETATKVRLKLKSGLKAGTYVVMWKNLSVDGHVLTDFFVFNFMP